MRRRRFAADSLVSRTIFVLMLNAVPIILTISIGWLRWQGKTEFVPGTESLAPILFGMGAAIFLLIVLAGFVGPVQVGALRRLTRRDAQSPLEGVRRIAAVFFGPMLYLGAFATLLLVVVNIAAIVFLFWHFTITVLRLQG